MPVTLNTERSASGQAVLEPVALPTLSSEPLVSVLIANYNYEQFVGQAIQSVLDQTYRNWELIICDDGSSDGSIARIEGYRSRDVRIGLTRQENSGHAAALNSAYSKCRGEIICLLDSDDLYYPDKLERVVNSFARHPECGLLVHRLIRVNGKRRRQGVWPLSDSLPEGWFGPELLRNGGIVPYMPPTSGLVLRREVADTLFPLVTKGPLRSCPDQVIMRNAPLITPIVRVLEPLGEYRLHNANSYSQRRVTVDSIGREIELSRALWREQSRFLCRSQRTTGAQLASWEKNTLIAMLQYMRAKLSGNPYTRAYHRQFLCFSAKETSQVRRLFWSASVYFPRPVFASAVNLLLGQSWLKQMFAQLRGLA